MSRTQGLVRPGRLPGPRALGRPRFPRVHRIHKRHACMIAQPQHQAVPPAIHKVVVSRQFVFIDLADQEDLGRFRSFLQQLPDDVGAFRVATADQGT